MPKPIKPETLIYDPPEDRHHRRRAPEPTEAEAPPRPEYLDAVAVEHWERLAPPLVAAGILTQMDGGNLALYCQSLADVERLTKEIRTEGEVVQSTRGTLTKNPRCLLLREARETVSRTAAQLGLSPTSRRRVSKVPKKLAHDPWDDM